MVRWERSDPRTTRACPRSDPFELRFHLTHQPNSSPYQGEARWGYPHKDSPSRSRLPLSPKPSLGIPPPTIRNPCANEI
ncbi:hypothetical protein ABIE28_002243 [Devosia sp. 2618]